MKLYWVGYIIWFVALFSFTIDYYLHFAYGWRFAICSAICMFLWVFIAPRIEITGGKGCRNTKR